MSTMQKGLFWVFIPLFVLISVATLAAIFLGVGHLNERERFILVNGFLVEIGLAVVALFYAAFNLSRSRVAKIRLNYSDAKAFLGKQATVTAYKAGSVLREVQTQVLNEDGPYILLDLASGSDAAYVKVAAGQKSYVGSFTVGNYPVTMEAEQ